MTTPAHDKIIALRNKLDIENKEHDAIAGMLTSAEAITNGSAGDLQVLSETVGQIAFFLGREKIHEPEKLQRQAAETAAACALNCQTRADIASGKLRPLMEHETKTKATVIASFGKLKVFDRQTAYVIILLVAGIFLYMENQKGRKALLEKLEEHLKLTAITTHVP